LRFSHGDGAAVHLRKSSGRQPEIPEDSAEGHYLAWWKDYLKDEGFEVEHRPLSDLKSFSDLASLPQGSRAMLVFQIPHMGIGQILYSANFWLVRKPDDVK
jgi:hypothetical protein